MWKSRKLRDEHSIAINFTVLIPLSLYPDGVNPDISNFDCSMFRSFGENRKIGEMEKRVFSVGLDKTIRERERES